MGCIIRFIHNRDKATENIVYQCSRASMLGMVPGHVLRSLSNRFSESHAAIHERSILMNADQVINSNQTASAGMFTVGLRPSRRNSTHRVPVRGKLRRQIKNHLTKTNGPAYPRGERVTVSVMTAGIWINGRQWKQHMYVTYTNSIPRVRPESANDPSTYSVGQIISFHVYLPKDLNIVIARVWKYKVHETWKGMWITDNAEPVKSEYI